MLLSSIVEFSYNEHTKKQTTSNIPPPVISSDTTRNRPSHQPTRSRSQTSQNTGRIPPASFTQTRGSPHKILLSPLMSPFNSNSFTPFIDFPLPPLTESSNFISSSTDSMSSSDTSLDALSTVPPPFNYNSPKHTDIKKINKPVAFQIDNDFPENCQNYVARTQGGKFGMKKMTDDHNFAQRGNTYKYDKELGDKLEHDKEYSMNMKTLIDDNMHEKIPKKKNVKYKHLAALGYVPTESDSEEQDQNLILSPTNKNTHLTHIPTKREQRRNIRSLPGMVRQTSPYISDKRYQKHNFRVNTHDWNKY